MIASIRLADAPLVVDGLAFVDDKLWVVRPAPEDDSRGDVIAIDPATNKVAERVTIPRTFVAMSGGAEALWYVRGTDLLRFDTRHAANECRAPRRDRRTRRLPRACMDPCGDDGDRNRQPRTGATIGEPIPIQDTVNVTAAIAPDIIWLAAQPDSSSPGTVTPYDLTTHRAVGPATRIGLPIFRMTDTGRALWVDAGGVYRDPVRALTLQISGTRVERVARERDPAQLAIVDLCAEAHVSTGLEDEPVSLLLRVRKDRNRMVARELRHRCVVPEAVRVAERVDMTVALRDPVALVRRRRRDPDDVGDVQARCSAGCRRTARRRS